MKRIIAGCLCMLCLLLCACTPQPAGPAASAQPAGTPTAQVPETVTPQITESSWESVPARLNFSFRQERRLYSDAVREARYLLCYRDDGSGVNHTADRNYWVYRNAETGVEFSPADYDACWVDERQLPQYRNGVLAVVSKDGTRRGVFDGEIYWPQLDPHESLVNVFQDGESICMWMVACTSPEADRVEVTGFYDNQYFSCKICDETGALMGTAWYTGRYGRLLYYVPSNLSETMQYTDCFYAGNGWIGVCSNAIRQGNWLVRTEGVRFINLENQEVRERGDIEQITVDTWYCAAESPIRYRDRDGCYGYLNANGENAVRELFAKADAMKNSAVVRPLDANSAVYIDPRGNRLWEGAEFSWACPMHGVTAAAKDPRYYGYYNSEGELLSSLFSCEDFYLLFGEPGAWECDLDFDFRPLLQQDVYLWVDAAEHCAVYTDRMTGEELFRFTVPPIA